MSRLSCFKALRGSVLSVSLKRSRGALTPGGTELPKEAGEAAASKEADGVEVPKEAGEAVVPKEAGEATVPKEADGA